MNGTETLATELFHLALGGASVVVSGLVLAYIKRYVARRDQAHEDFKRQVAENTAAVRKLELELEIHIARCDTTAKRSGD